MVEVLLVSNGEIKDIEKIKEIIKNLGDDFFIQSNITTITAGKDIQNQLLKAKATHKRQKESKGR